MVDHDNESVSFGNHGSCISGELSQSIDVSTVYNDHVEFAAEIRKWKKNQSDCAYFVMMDSIPAHILFTFASLVESDFLS